ncbi:hypothetical protein CDD81_3072 [Ophiocordyceps australis]|uniref:Phosphoinositide phospholipase C n=1 Tax=Ophiocordyceps australis TaxID=1399860 RepID=A0A2C5YC70_9HYPO|nr:hypothetical protein CDD81_3072 [Ophiocordyceps australis]
MAPWCGLVGRHRQHGMPRARTLSLFGNDSNPQALASLRRMIGVTAFTSQANESRRDGKILMSTDMHETLGRLFAQLCAPGASRLSRSRFVDFLAQVQGEEVAALQLDSDAYDLGAFLFVWFNLVGLEAVAPLPEQDLSKPLTNYFINSSHNTYLDGHQWTSTSKPESYTNVLSRGCRCIEIDVWNNMDATPSRDRSKSPSASHHSRGLSTSSVSNAALNMLDKAASAYDLARSYLGDPLASHSHSPSHSRVPDDASPKSSLVFHSADALDAASPSSRPARLSRHALPPGEPIVTHGWTLTTPCGFRDVCKAIRDSAFVNNDLPIIISLEVHADDTQQEVMVRIMKDVWGHMLVSQPHEGCDPRFRVPTLAALRNKILVKVKRAPPKMEPAVSSPSTNHDCQRPAMDLLSQSLSTSLDNVPSVSEPTLSQENISTVPSVSEPTQPLEKTTKVHICQSLAQLAVYTRSEHFESLETPQAKRPTHIFSISEDRILDLVNKQKHQVLAHNKNYFMRAFPAVRRIGSSNPDPSVFWRNGVQMVALNWQHLDEAMMLNHAMFADEKGWVLKPQGYQSGDKTANEPPDLAAQGLMLDLTITIFAGHNLLSSDSHDASEHTRSARSIRPVVKVQLHVGGSDKETGASECEYKHRTEARKTNHPSFGHCGDKMQFLNIPNVVPQFSFVRVKIEDEQRSGLGSQQLLSWACIRLDRLRQGYRFIHLMDCQGKVQGGKLLVKISKKMH